MCACVEYMCTFAAFWPHFGVDNVVDKRFVILEYLLCQSIMYPVI